MRILLSGASSFTGYWFVKELRQAGHQVTCLFRRPSSEDYEGLRALRVRTLVEEGEAIFSCDFGSTVFLDAASQPWDIYAHHAADVENYRSPDFDALRALENNTRNLRQVLATLKQGGCRRVVLTGSVFEQGEGAGSDGLPAILPYGLSKSLTSQVFEFESAKASLQLGKFVIPNPFGCLQEPRFVQHLLSTWRRGETAQVATPAYVRDNIPVELLAMEYRHFLEHLPHRPGCSRRSPSGIVGSQGAFAQLVARQMQERLGWHCKLELLPQTVFEEPAIRINSESVAQRHPQWQEAQVWDGLAAEASRGHSSSPENSPR